MIRINNLNKAFGKHQVLKDVTLHFEAGKGIALIGPNGSGKTTLIKVLLGLVLADKGEVLLEGRSILGESDYRKQVGYMPQVSRFPENLTVKKLFQMMKSLRADVQEKNYDLDLYRAFQIDQLGDKRLEILSGGMKQKVSAALAFIFNPKVLILDEPTAGLDPVSNEVLKEKLKMTIENGKLVLISSHILNDLDDIATDVAYMMDGELKFFKSLGQLKSETSEVRLNKIVAQVLHNENSYV